MAGLTFLEALKEMTVVLTRSHGKGTLAHDMTHCDTLQPPSVEEFSEWWKGLDMSW